MKRFVTSDFPAMERFYRTNLINSVSGFKSACLCGTQSPDGVPNLAVISSVVHIGANPPQQGFIMRPTTVERQTYDYLKSTGWFTLNHIGTDFVEAAHQCSARYSREDSEFEATELTPKYSELHPAPYVAESPVQLGLRFIEEHHLGNGTLLIIGQIEELIVAENGVLNDGFLDLTALGTAAVSGLDGYYSTEQIARFSYAKKDQPLRRI